MKTPKDELHDALNECDSYKAAWEKVSAEYAGTLKEIRALTDQIDLNRDEFQRIAVIASTGVGAKFNEILSLCDRAAKVITQNVPVIEERNRFEKQRNEAWRALNQIEVHFGLGDGSQCSPQEIADKLTLP